MTNLVYLDTETTGLDPELHDIWEVAWAVNDEPIQSRILPHSLQTANPESLAMNGYWDRANWGFEPRWGEDYDVELKTILAGNTIIGANPGFDTAFLRSRWGVTPWHYRMIDVESFAMAVMQWDRPRGLKDISTELIQLGYNVKEPDHSAAGDVFTLRDSYIALKDIRSKLGWR